jgi:ATP/maltotriose-dependent transcriptional regulator MalT
MVRGMLAQPLAEALVALGDLDTADSVAAEELVRAAAEASFVRGNAQYSMNQVRGRVALRRGNREAAVEYLRLAGRTEGSPQLSSFGPRLVLARELLEAGERQAVLEFLESVRGFWTGPEARTTLDAALATIDAGGVPSGRRWR